jgi:hypothetical protein
MHVVRQRFKHVTSDIIDRVHYRLSGHDHRATLAHYPDTTIKTRRPSAEAYRGFDAGKKIKGRKRHIVTDTQGNLVGLLAHEAGVQDRDGAPRVFTSIRALYPWLRHVFAAACLR